MTVPPGDPGTEYEVVIHSGRRSVWVARARVLGREAARGGAVASRAAGRGGRAGLVRLRAYLRTPEGRQSAVRAGKAVAVAAALVGGFVLVRGWLDSARRGMAAAAGAFRAAAGAVGAAARAAGLVIPLRWVGRLLSWLFLGGSASRQRVHCPDCQARVRADAHVCYRCGFRPASGETVADAATGRRLLASMRWLWRALGLRVARSCPDCCRRVHADARVCWHCGYRLRRAAC